MAGGPEPALLLRGVTVRGDGGRKLLDAVDLTVEASSHWALLGANGAGKSTLLAVARGELRPQSGEVLAFGQPFAAAGVHDPRLLIGSLRSDRRQFAPGLTVTDVVALQGATSAALRGASTQRADGAEVRAKLGLFGCAGLAARSFATCSQGERQRILLARAMMREPSLLLLDEPAAALDIVGRQELLGALGELARERPGLASVTAAHGPEELPPTISHVALLRAGRLLAAGPVDEVLTAERLSACYDLPLGLHRVGAGWAVGVAG